MVPAEIIVKVVDEITRPRGSISIGFGSLGDLSEGLSIKDPSGSNGRRKRGL